MLSSEGRCFLMENKTFFTKMVDELVMFSEHDPELKEGLQWADKLAQKKRNNIL